MVKRLVEEFGIDPMDDDGNYLGAIKLNSKWRFCYDDRFKWVLDFKTFPTDHIPKERLDILTISVADADKYVGLMDVELSLSQIKSIVGKLPLSVIVNFDDLIFVNGSNDEGFEDLSDFVPANWKSLKDNPFYYVPANIRDAWVTKHVGYDGETPAKRVGIPEYTYVGAVKFEGEWYLFYEQSDAWILDFKSFITKSRPHYFDDPIYSDWRRDLQQVDESNAQQYLNFLKLHELKEDEIPVLVYNVLASRFYDDNPVKFTQPALQYVVNFDERLFVYRAYNTAQIKLNVEPARRYIPSHWTCYQDDTYKYIPAELSKQWLLAELK